MGRAFEYRKAAKLKRWGNMARVFTRVGKQIAIAVSPLIKVFWKGEFEGKNLFFKKGFPLIFYFEK